MEFNNASIRQINLLVFLVLVLAGIVEGLIYQQVRQQSFSWKTVLASLGVSFGQRMVGLVSGGIIPSQFEWLHDHRIFTVPMDQWWSVPLLFITSEFFYYWEHRLSHKIRWFWATHAVHHTPEQLSLSSAFRLSWTGPFTGLSLLFAPVALLGFPLQAIFIMIGGNLLYQFWLHTELIPRLGWFDQFFNSPSNHRVHHGQNSEYIDKNYGGILIVFDRLFGTYQPEVSSIAIKYGVASNVPSYNPLVILHSEWIAIFRDLSKAKGWNERLHFLFSRPGWRPHFTEVESEVVNSLETTL